MRSLLVAVIVMGVLIVAGVATIVVTIVERAAGSSAAPLSQPILLSEPAGSRIAAIAAAPDRVVLQLQGGGPDRIVVLDGRNGQVLFRAAVSK